MPRWPLSSFLPMGLSMSGALLLAGCASGPVRLPGETDARCIHRLYDYPNRFEPFPTAASDCAGGRPLDLTGDHYYQVLASSLNIPFVDHEPGSDRVITLTGSRFPQSTSEPPPPELRLEPQGLLSLDPAIGGTFGTHP